jgi:hypothetical protein
VILGLFLCLNNCMRNFMKLLESMQWPETLSGYELIDYVVDQSTDDIDPEMVENYFGRDASAQLMLVPIESLREGDPDHNIPSRQKAKEYAKLDPATMPPLVVEDGKIMDGNHRYRDAVTRGLKSLWCYVIQ